MRILMSRVRIGVQEPTYSYRLYVPFAEISLERQALVSMHSDFGHGAGLLARLADVIAPMDHLERPPGLDKRRSGTLIDAVADRVGAVLLAAAFPEMDAPAVPFRLIVPTAPPNAMLFGSINNLAGRYAALSDLLPTVTPAALAFQPDADR